MLRPLAIGRLLLAVEAGPLAARAAAAVVVDQTGAPTVLSARDGRFVWSQRRGSRWRLVTLAGGAVHPVPVALRPGGPFDVDLGALLPLAGGPSSPGLAGHLDAAGGRIVLRWRDPRGTAVVLLTAGPPGTGVARTDGRVLAADAPGTVADVTPRRG